MDKQYICKVGDQVWKRAEDRILKGRAVMVDVKNKHGYPLDVLVKWEDGTTSQESPCKYDTSPSVIPPDADVPAAVSEIIKKFPQLTAVRIPSSQCWRYTLAGKDTLNRLTIVRMSEEVSDLIFDDDDRKWYEGKPEVMDGSTHICVDNELELELEYNSYI